MPQTQLIAEPAQAVAQLLAVQIQTARDKRDVQQLVRLMNEVRVWLDVIKETSTKFTELYDRLRFTSLPDAMADTGTHNVTVAGIGKCYLTDDVAVTATDKSKLIEWLEGQGLEDMVGTTINAQTLTAFVRKRLKESAANRQPPQLPMGLLNIRPYTRAVIQTK